MQNYTLPERRSYSNYLSPSDFGPRPHVSVFMCSLTLVIQILVGSSSTNFGDLTLAEVSCRVTVSVLVPQPLVQEAYEGQINSLFFRYRLAPRTFGEGPPPHLCNPFCHRNFGFHNFDYPAVFQHFLRGRPCVWVVDETETQF